jgi:protein-S-isoprenylcysteine O-methyltransferase Ste14
VALIGLEGILSLQTLASLPPSNVLGWLSVGSGLCVAAAGVWIAFRGIRELGTNLTAVPAPRRNASLVEAGIYARVRHPIYAGVIAVSVGWALVAVSLPALLVAGALALWLDLKSRREEVWLVAHHPGYAGYRRRTRRFVPGVY